MGSDKWVNQTDAQGRVHNRSVQMVQIVNDDGTLGTVGGGGGPVTIADGVDVTQGAKADAAWDGAAASPSIVAVLKRIGAAINATTSWLTVSGRAASGAAVAGNPVLVGGSDGTNARVLNTDTSGRQQIVIATALPAGTNALGTVKNTQVSTRYHGVKAGSTTASQFPSQALTQGAYFKAPVSNVNSVFLGLSGVTVEAGTTTTTTGWELQPGESSPFIPAANLNEVYLIGTAATDDIIYMGW